MPPFVTREQNLRDVQIPIGKETDHERTDRQRQISRVPEPTLISNSSCLTGQVFQHLTPVTGHNLSLQF